MNEGDRQMKPMTRKQALDKLASAEYGRIVFTQHAMPAIRPVNHVLSDGRIIILSHDGSAIATRADHHHGNVVVYEADQIDPRTRTGWSVTVTGLARIVEDPALIALYQQALHPWVAGSKNTVIGIDTDIVAGFELTEADTGTPDS
jgi:nitroimidazol reductase NimA-like FMN-containing flavoprotein (pyridoxamine 5'-phosphate oxidase superfamily)